MLALLFVALGCATTYLVAWTCAIHAFAAGGGPGPAADGSGWEVNAWVGPNNSSYQFNPPLDRDGRVEIQWPLTDPAQLLVTPNWFTAPAADPTLPLCYRAFAAGWPWQCAFGVERFFFDGQPTGPILGDEEECRRVLTGLIKFGDSPLPSFGEYLPFLPIWPEFAANTGIFSATWAVLWLLGWALFTPRRRRLAKGQCPRCSYDLRGEFLSGCSECGWGKSGMRPARRNWRSVTLQVVALAPIGAMTAAFVTVACVMFTPRTVVRPEWRKPEGYWLVWRVQGFGHEAHTVQLIREWDLHSNPSTPPPGAPPTPSWGRAPQPSEWCEAEFSRAGWPMFAFTATRTLTQADSVSSGSSARNWRTLIEASPVTGVGVGYRPSVFGDTTIPLSPLWPGLLINSLFYGAIVWLLLTAWRRWGGKGLTPEEAARLWEKRRKRRAMPDAEPGVAAH